MNIGTLRFSVALATALVVISADSQGTGLTTSAEALVGRPATPVSYAGVARRTTARAVTPGVGYGRPGVGYGGVGGPASGAGVLPGAGVGRVGVGRNRGGPVNRVGRW